MRSFTRSNNNILKCMNNNMNVGGCDTVVPAKELKEAFDILDRQSILKHKGPLTAELLDEEDENGPVVMKDKNGSSVLLMPRDVYEEIRKQ